MGAREEPLMSAVPVPAGPRGRVTNTLAMLREPYEATYRWREQFGPTYTTRVLTGDFVVTGDPELVRQLLRTPADSFAVHGANTLEPMVGSHSIFSLHGAPHARERKLLMPPFHGERMRAYAEVMTDVAARQAASWQPGQEVRLLDVARTITSEVIVRAVFGVSDADRVQRYLEVIGAWVDAWRPAFILIPALRWELGGLSPWARFVRARAVLNEMLEQQIATRRQTGERGEDILSMMLDARYEDGTEMSDEGIRDELRALLIAGHETTMIAIAWAFHFLHRDAGALERTVATATSIGDAAAMGKDPWLTAVTREAMRIHPIIPAFFRRIAAPVQLGPHALEPGQTVCVSIVMLHSHEGVWPDPFTFRAERFEDRTFKAWEFLPFGGGHRRCIGAAMAEYEARVVLGTILREHRFGTRPAGPVPIARRNLSMAPVDHVPLTYLGRR
jgi:cytochrome P450